jgi:hypothetical protein
VISDPSRAECFHRVFVHDNLQEFLNSVDIITKLKSYWQTIVAMKNQGKLPCPVSRSAVNYFFIDQASRVTIKDLVTFFHSVEDENLPKDLGTFLKAIGTASTTDIAMNEAFSSDIDVKTIDFDDFVFILLKCLSNDSWKDEEEVKPSEPQSSPSNTVSSINRLSLGDDMNMQNNIKNRLAALRTII